VRRDFVANVSHELKTPIGALGLLAETMAATDDTAVVRQLADRVVRESDRLARIVDDLLDLSTIEAQEAPTRGPMPVRLLLSESVADVQAAATAAAVPLSLGPEPADIEIFCDPRQMRSALVNLLDNAIKYSGPEQPVEVGACVVDERVAFVVRDHGIGIPTRDLERIWERFYRVDRARSRDTGGTGLGLAIVRHVAQAHGGEVTVQSREGEGSTFTLYIPLANGSARGLTDGN
jgi:two-component system sensor histidine kinase SenX3